MSNQGFSNEEECFSCKDSDCGTLNRMQLSKDKEAKNVRSVVNIQLKKRPIPNLIPLNVSTKLRAMDNSPTKQCGMELVASHTNSCISFVKTESNDSMHECNSCHSFFSTHRDLTIHTESLHADELFTKQHALNTSENGMNREDNIDVSTELWKSAFEKNNSGVASVCKELTQSITLSNDEDDVEELDNVARKETYCGIETAPGYGEVTSKIPADVITSVLMKKVFKCPHCSFWASTASRFHVHIVGHLNKKPFECSLCAYRSNWRWDITKHIRLKAIRDPSHRNARVLMNDETGRRNYTKYNKYVTLMRVSDSISNDNSQVKRFSEDVSRTTIDDCNLSKVCKEGVPNISPLKKQDEVVSAVPEDIALLKCNSCDFRGPSEESLLQHSIIHNEVVNSVEYRDPMQLTSVSSINENYEQGKHSHVNDFTYIAVSPTITSTHSDTASSVGLTEPNTEMGLVYDEMRDFSDNNAAHLATQTWRQNAPYRCGHCHQVSNWKHVIQRHCRLKHNGNVLIELINSKKMPIDDKNLHPSKNKKHLKQSNMSHNKLRKPQTSAARTRGQSIERPSATVPATSENLKKGLPELAGNFTDCNNLTSNEFISTDFSCSAATDNFNTSIELNALLQDSVKLAEPKSKPIKEDNDAVSPRAKMQTNTSSNMCKDAIDSTSKYSNDVSKPNHKLLYFCSFCPSVFLEERLIEMHNARHFNRTQFACHYCTYNDNSSQAVDKHQEIHFKEYQNQTEQLVSKFRQSRFYCRPKLCVNTQGQCPIWTTEQNDDSALPVSTLAKQMVDETNEVDPLKNTVLGSGDFETSSFLCKYCENIMDTTSTYQEHLKIHFSAILVPSQNVNYYTSLNNLQRKRKRFELVITKEASDTKIRLLYDNDAKCEWNDFLESEKIILKFQ